jgi:hypothetical protein
VVYVGRASFWTEHDSELFKEMPESPWPAMEVPSGGEVRSSSGVGTDGGSGALLGLSVSGPIILQASDDSARHGDLARQDRSNGIPMPAGEVLTARIRRERAKPSLMPLLAVTFGAFSIGLLVSPLSDAPVLRNQPASVVGRASGVGAVVASDVTPSAPAPILLAPVLPTVVPMVQVTAYPAEPAATAGRTSRPGSKPAPAGMKLAANKRGRGHNPTPAPVPPRKATPPTTSGSATATAAANDNADIDPDFDADLTSRKSTAKESIDATKRGATSVNSERKPTSPAWVDPWAN